jgi:hypothetical protein
LSPTSVVVRKEGVRSPPHVTVLLLGAALTPLGLIDATLSSVLKPNKLALVENVR